MLRFVANKKIAFIFLAFFLFIASISNASASTNIDDPYYENQWYLKKIGYNYVHDYGLRGQSPIIAVIDSGVDIDHPDLVGNIWVNKGEIPNDGVDNDLNGFIDDVYGWNFVENNPNPRPIINSRSNDDGLNHGTMIAGIIAAKTNNGIGISGIASNSKIMALRALDDKGEGKVNDVIRAIDYAVKNGANIINLSFSGDAYNKAFEDAIDRAHRAGVIVVSAVGNKNFNLNQNLAYPSCFTFDSSENAIIGVASLDTLNQKASFSSYGSNCVDISAPGVSFFSTSFYDEVEKDYIEYLGYWSGTSMSAAVVSGVIALIKEVNPKLSKNEILEVLFKSSDNISMLNSKYGSDLGSGSVNAFNSVRWADEKWDNMNGKFLLYPQNKVENYSSSENPYNFKIVNNKYDFVDSLSLDENNFYNKTSITIGDVDGDGLLDIVIGSGLGDSPYVKIFDIKGNLKGQFFAYDEKFKGGVNVALGDIDGDGSLDIVTGAGPGGGPHVRIFNSRGILTGQFFAYENNFHGGVKVAVANIYGSDTKRNKEIVVAPGAGRLAEVKIFDNFGKERKSIVAYSDKFKGGVNLSVADINKDGLDEIITGAGPGGAPHVRVFDGGGKLAKSFYGLDVSFSGGIIPVYIEDYKQNVDY